MRIVLTSVTDELSKAWRTFCGHLDGVEIHHGSILDVDGDAVVSPANSFGFMDGGIDAVYLKRFGRSLQARVRAAIADRHGGELLVGAADIVRTGASRPPYLIIAPTMRVPMILRDTVNPYLAARAVFRLIRHGTFPAGEQAGMSISEEVGVVAIPGLGTGVGRVSPAVCARQVAAAWKDVVGHGSTPPATWAEASERHQLLYTHTPRRLQREPP